MLKFSDLPSFESDRYTRDNEDSPQNVITRIYARRILWPGSPYSKLTRAKANLSLCLTNYTLRHEDVWGSGCIDLHFLDLSTSWRRVVSFALLPFYSPGKIPRHPLDRRLDGPQSRPGRYEEVKILDPAGTRIPTPGSSSP
jgi:hypothetical protein